MPNLIVLAIPAFIVLMTVEAVADAIMRRDLYEFKDAAASITMGLGSVFVGLATKAPRLRCVSTISSTGKTIFIAGAHRDDGRRFIVHADEKLSAFVELERAIHEFAVSLIA